MTDPTPKPKPTRKRRQHGSGSVSQRADGLWIGQIRAGYNLDGKPRRITVSAKLEKDCKAKLEKVKAQIARDETPVVGKIDLKKWSDTWLTRKVKTVRPKTYSNYQSVTWRWIVPIIGHRKLDMLTPDDIAKVLDATREPDPPRYPAGRGPATARKVHVVLMELLKDASVAGHPVPPRVLLVDAPGVGVSDRRALEPVDAMAILGAASDHPDASRWAAALLEGMRQGECLGLTWDMVDLDNATIDVSWQLQAIPYAHGCGKPDNRTYPCKRRFGGNCPDRLARVPDGYEARHLEGAWHLTRPKTARGQRILPMVPWLTAALTAWKAAAPYSRHNLVWPRVDGGPRLPDSDTEAWEQLQGTAGTRHPTGRAWHLHEARNTTATLLLDAGIDPTTVTAILGHSTITTSRGYMQVSQALARQAMDAVAARLQIGGPLEITAT